MFSGSEIKYYPVFVLVVNSPSDPKREQGKGCSKDNVFHYGDSGVINACPEQAYVMVNGI